ncbi:MAG: DUF3048 domain-containing protein [Clostridia bacterium]|nr:DUF3048 domain-containing protein [Clostridia bacterium]
MKKTAFVWMLVPALALMLLAGCGTDTPDPSLPPVSESVGMISSAPSAEPTDIPDAPTSATTPGATPTPAPDNFTMKVTEAPAVANPLTGLAAQRTDARPVAVMINNIKKALPQHGLKDADILYEIPAEGGISRLLAIYNDVSKVGVIGSVRSSRPIFIDVAASYDAVYIHHGGSPEAYEMLNAGKVYHLDGIYLEGSVFYRDAARRKTMGYEHSSMTTGAKITAKLLKSQVRMTANAPAPAFRFSYNDIVPAGNAAESFTVRTGNYEASYDFLPEYGTYMRTQHGWSSDANGTGKLDFRNVFVLQMKYSVISGDAKGRLKFENIGSGKGYYITNGKMQEITWKWSAANARMKYYAADGSELSVNAGKSMIHFVSSLGNVKVK